MATKQDNKVVTKFAVLAAVAVTAFTAVSGYVTPGKAAAAPPTIAQCNMFRPHLDTFVTTQGGCTAAFQGFLNQMKVRYGMGIPSWSGVAVDGQFGYRTDQASRHWKAWRRGTAVLYVSSGSISGGQASRDWDAIVHDCKRDKNLWYWCGMPG